MPVLLARSRLPSLGFLLRALSRRGGYTAREGHHLYLHFTHSSDPSSQLPCSSTFPSSHRILVESERILLQFLDLPERHCHHQARASPQVLRNHAMGTSENPVIYAAHIPQRQQKSSGIQNQRHLSEPHATTSIATAHESLPGQLGMRQRRATEVETYNPPANSQLYYTEGTMLGGAPRAQPPISEDWTISTSNRSSVQLTSGSPGVPLSLGHSQSPNGIVAVQSSPHLGRVPLATIATAVAHIGPGATGPEGISTGTNNPHIYSSPVAMEAPCTFTGQPQQSTTPTRASRRPSRINTANFEKSASLGHWTDGLVKPPPPIPRRPRSQDGTSNSRTSTGLWGSQHSRSSEATMQPASRSMSSFSHLIRGRSSSNEQGSGFDPTNQMRGLGPLTEEPTSDDLHITVPFHGSQASSSSTLDMNPSLLPQAQQTHPSGHQFSRTRHGRRQTDVYEGVANLAVVPDKRSDECYMRPGEFTVIADDAASVMTTDSYYKRRRWFRSSR